MAATFLFDGDCGFCTSSAKLLRRWVPTHAAIVPWQREDLRELGVRPDQAAKSVQWVDGTERCEGPDAIAALLRSGRGPWTLVGRALSAPPVRAVAWPAYRWVSRHRHRFPGGLPECAVPEPGTLPASLPTALWPRRRQDSDVQAAVRLLYVVHDRDARYPSPFPDKPRQWLSLDDGASAWVVRPEGRVLGHVATGSPAGEPLRSVRWREVTGLEPEALGTVERVLVSPEVRRRGIGTALVGVAAADIRRAGRLPVAEVDAGPAAVALFERLGWQLLGLYPSDGVPGEHLSYYAAPSALRSDAE